MHYGVSPDDMIPKSPFKSREDATSLVTLFTKVLILPAVCILLLL
jgi:hypothetical protein